MLITGELCGVRASMGTLCTFCSNLLWMVLLYKVKSIKERERIGIGGRRWMTGYGFATERSRKLSSSWQGSGGSGERSPASLRWASSTVCGKKVDLLRAVGTGRCMGLRPPTWVQSKQKSWQSFSRWGNMLLGFGGKSFLLAYVCSVGWKCKENLKQKNLKTHT